MVLHIREFFYSLLFLEDMYDQPVTVRFNYVTAVIRLRF